MSYREELDPLEELERLTAAQKRRTRFRKRVGCIFAAWLLAYAGNGLFGWGLDHVLFYFPVNLLSLILFAGDFRLSDKIDKAIRRLSERGGVAEIGPLALALPNTTVDQALLTRILVRLLSRFSAGDADKLDGEARRALFDSLKRDPRKNSQYHLALLQALEQLGDPDALPLVERLADRVHGMSGLDRVAEAADQCLEALRIPYEQKRGRETYLRSVESKASEELLRPAGNATADHARLLRAETEP